VAVQFRICVFELTIFLDALAADGGWLTWAIFGDVFAKTVDKLEQQPVRAITMHVMTFIRPHRKHTVQSCCLLLPMFRGLYLSVCLYVCLSVCLSVCMSVGDNHELCQNGCTNRHIVWVGTQVGPKKRVIRGNSDSKG